ncbi:MAG: hypothetical protein QM662_02480 [Gordonia sp. (in: high G+C Gram-positive bacteria)]
MIPALFDVGHKMYLEGAVDDWGNPVDTWADPVSKKFITWADYATEDPKLAGHDRDVVDAGIIVYPDFGSVSPRDRMVIDGIEYEVIGSPERNDKAWWDCDVLNRVINLKSVSG